MALPEPRIDPEDELVCLGHDEDLTAQGGALAPPIVPASLFAQPSFRDLLTGFGAEHRHHVYSRGQNPTVEAVEHKLARLEGGETCKCFASGMAAVSAVLMGLLAADDHVLFVNNTYGPTLQLAAQLRRFGVAHDVVLDLGLDSVAAALRPRTKLLWVESPGTMLFRVADLRGLAGLARERGITTVIDNSWATPLFQKPLALGIDLAVHSATKYVGGHSDVVAGAVVGGEDLLERIFYRAFLLHGGILGPFDAWLLNRGLRTLPVRMRQHHRDALEVARFLADHPAVRQVFHPGLEPDDLVRAQLRGYSGLFSFELASDRFDDVERFIDRLRLFKIGVSWGGVESLVITPASGRNAASLSARRIPPGTVRLSIGLEGADVLIADLERALAGTP